MVILFILGVMEPGEVWLELHIPHDVKGQKVYKFAEIWRVVSRYPRFWLDVVSATPVAFFLVCRAVPPAPSFALASSRSSPGKC